MQLGDRMKRYEAVYKSTAMPKTPAIIRVDGKAFHTWTKGLDSPFDYRFYMAMARTAQELVNNIQGAVCAYGQSDEISIFLKDYSNYDTEAWFQGSVQKIASVSASMATAYFNEFATDIGLDKPPALFDSRIFSLPHHEVTNYFIWRQADFLRNSVQSVARHYLGHKACQNLSRNEMIEALRNMDNPVDWDKDLITLFKHGYFYARGNTQINMDLPLFVESRDFIEAHIYNN